MLYGDNEYATVSYGDILTEILIQIYLANVSEIFFSQFKTSTFVSPQKKATFVSSQK